MCSIARRPRPGRKYRDGHESAAAALVIIARIHISKYTYFCVHLYCGALRCTANATLRRHLRSYAQGSFKMQFALAYGYSCYIMYIIYGGRRKRHPHRSINTRQTFIVRPRGLSLWVRRVHVLNLHYTQCMCKIARRPRPGRKYRDGHESAAAALGHCSYPYLYICISACIYTVMHRECNTAAAPLELCTRLV